MFKNNMPIYKNEQSVLVMEDKCFMKSQKKKICYTILYAILAILCLTGCGNSKEKILIYSSAEDYRIERMREVLNEKFPEYDIAIEYMSTGNQAAKLLVEGIETECDITHDMEYGYMEQLDKAGILADLSSYDKSIYTEDAILSQNYLPVYRLSGAIIVNTEVLAEKGLKKPAKYEDLLNPEYKGLISMPNPKSSGTGYVFYKNLVNAWGEEETLAYFDALTSNILQYTSSGSGPVNALVQGEVAIGLGMTSQAVLQINEGAPLEIFFFAEGSPYTIYGQSIIKGKENRECVKEVFDFLVNEWNYENAEKYCPEKIYKDIDFEVENYPQNITYGDMGNNGVDEKTRLLDKWKY